MYFGKSAMSVSHRASSFSMKTLTLGSGNSGDGNSGDSLLYSRDLLGKRARRSAAGERQMLFPRNRTWIDRAEFRQGSEKGQVTSSTADGCRQPILRLAFSALRVPFALLIVRILFSRGDSREHAA